MAVPINYMRFLFIPWWIMDVGNRPRIEEADYEDFKDIRGPASSTIGFLTRVYRTINFMQQESRNYSNGVLDYNSDNPNTCGCVNNPNTYGCVDNSHVYYCIDNHNTIARIQDYDLEHYKSCPDVELQYNRCRV